MSQNIKTLSTLPHTSTGLTNFLLMPGQTIPGLFSQLVPAYESRNYGPLVVSLDWSDAYAHKIAQISPKRTANRLESYLANDELGRAYLKFKSKRDASIRFGVEKKGHGYTKERGDFCLVGGVVRAKEITVFYRSLEMIGGFAYDLCLFEYLERWFETKWKRLNIVACKVFTFALKGNSNEKLYPKLKEIYNA